MMNCIYKTVIKKFTIGETCFFLLKDLFNFLIGKNPMNDSDRTGFSFEESRMKLVVSPGAADIITGHDLARFLIRLIGGGKFSVKIKSNFPCLSTERSGGMKPFIERKVRKGNTNRLCVGKQIEFKTAFFSKSEPRMKTGTRD